ncbi:MAG: hypothetical protein LBG48_02305 [Rickettsiales bacterium]|jgi:hypothetical protein|nr:hypothetical protein [Rickettsiales bacterium]
MAQATDENLKRSMEKVCAVDSFYSESNITRLRKAIADVEAGRAKLTEHELMI